MTTSPRQATPDSAPTERRNHDLKESALGPIEAASTRVRTHALLQHGIENLRIVSESQLLGVLRGMARESTGGAAAVPSRNEEARDIVAPSPDDALQASSVEGAYQSKWTQLRSCHEESLKKIEGRMERLSIAFRSLECIFEKVEARAATSLAASDVQGLPPPRRSDLLREMLLNDNSGPSAGN